MTVDFSVFQHLPPIQLHAADYLNIVLRIDTTLTFIVYARFVFNKPQIVTTNVNRLTWNFDFRLLRVNFEEEEVTWNGEANILSYVRWVCG